MTTGFPQTVLQAPIISPIQITQSAGIPVYILNNKTMEAKITCGEFTYSGYSTIHGSRSESLSERFQLFIEANGQDSTTDAVRIKNSFLLLLGQEAFEIYKTKPIADSSGTFKEVQIFKADHFVPKKSEYAVICAFRRAIRHKGELVSDYAMRLTTC